MKKREIEQATHTFKDPGSTIWEGDYRPRIYGSPEQTLAAAFIKTKRDYGGPLPADFVLYAVGEGAPHRQGP